MLRAVWNGTVLAEAPRTVRMEGNHYFPPESVYTKHFTKSKAKTLCPWKGIASYYDLTTEDAVMPNAAWYYPHPSPLARRIKNHVAFDFTVTVEGEREPDSDGASGLRGVWNRLRKKSDPNHST
ncbi:DUF427 domain-containing protein [Amycolatopsis cihanbeyliensis]|uniref:Uncharacterized protein (DUF427 family) n=1 Tax=Amycolatopsis cihanbeyliensis TaxID=1128664 RepID=A0A542DF58_AMYCI|nr:DUF427 domain-containing protein [Amycolatopsis cihanbeyliensis]TQJ01728.1 uncharacterized protein (DUF427 family) [Amycolatopsis cihanbeyliensis]